MPPRFTYWTIIAGGLPTAFRAVDRDEIMPTFQRLREKHPDAVLKWFAHGKLWESPEEARAAREQQRRPTDRRADRRARFEGRGPRTHDGGAAPREPRRDRDWRPGGEHRDPRKKFADAKKARNAAQRRQRFERKHGPAKPRSGDAPRDRLTGSPRVPESRGRDERRTSDLRGQPRGKKPFRPKSPGASQRATPRRQGQGARPFERPGFERKRESTPGRGPQPPSKFDDPSSPRREDDAQRRPPHEDRQRRGRFRRS